MKFFRPAFLFSAIIAWIFFLTLWLLVISDHFRMNAFCKMLQMGFVVTWMSINFIFGPLFCVSASFVLSREPRNKQNWTIFLSVLGIAVYFYFQFRYDWFCLMGCIFD